MTRQTSSAPERSDFDADAWITKWHSERAPYWSFLLVHVNEPLKEDDGVSVYVFPHLDARDMHGCFWDSRYRDKGYEVARCLLNEGLVNLLSAHVSTRQGSIGVHLERRFTLRLPGSSLPASSGNVAASPGGTLGRGAGGVAAGNAR
jgi:hypothetical protein